MIDNNKQFKADRAVPHQVRSRMDGRRDSDKKKLVDGCSNGLGLVGGLVSAVAAVIITLKYRTSPLNSALVIFVGGFVCYLLFNLLGALIGSLLWRLRSGGKEQSMAADDLPERQTGADEPLPGVPVIQAGSLFFKCPNCTEQVSVAQRQIDPLVGVNVACPACMDISHVPGGFHAEPLPPGYMIRAGERVPVAGFSDWYYENTFIKSLIKSGQADLLNDYGLWAFCGSCTRSFPASVLTSLAITQPMMQRGAGGVVFTSRTPDSGKSMESLSSGRCPQCGHEELIVIATVVPDNVRAAIPGIKKNTAYASAHKLPARKVARPRPKGRRRLLAMLAIGSAVVLLAWVMANHPALSQLKIFSGQAAHPIATPSAIMNAALPGRAGESGQTEDICWTHVLKDFDGTRAQAWEKALDEQTRNLLKYDQFLVDVVQHNPQLKDDGYVFSAKKTYLIPGSCP